MPILTTGAGTLTLLTGGGGGGGGGGCDEGAIVCDTFTDADNTLLSDHDPDIDTEGAGWANGNSAYEVFSNRCRCEGASNNRCVIDVGTGDMHVKFTGRWDDTPGTFYLGLIARYSSNLANWHARYEGDGDVLLWNGSTLVDSGNIGAPTQGQDYTLELICSGTSIVFKVDDTEVLSTTSSANQSNTYAGIRLGNICSIDNFQVLPP